MLKDVVRGNTATETIDFVMEICCSCHVPFMMPKQMKNKLLANKGEAFYCPNGHGQSYTGKSEADRLKEELERVKAQDAEHLENMQNRMLDEINKRKALEKQMKRVHKGVCSCCNRTFVNLQRHMKTQHPELSTKY